MINCLIDLCKLLSNKKLHDQIELNISNLINEFLTYQFYGLFNSIDLYNIVQRHKVTYY